MLKKLILQNFRQHESLTVSFAGGLNVIKGANEAGKSSLYEAVVYALYGAKALPLKLDDTVTWGKSVTSLCVTLVFDHAGIEYTIVRKKAGATLSCKDFTASGNAEVSAVVERILGVNLFVASAVTVVSQNSLQTLTAGSAGIKLIEGLSDVNYIDRLVSKLTAELPCGNTKLLESQLEQLKALNAPEPVPQELYDKFQEAASQVESRKTAEAGAAAVASAASALLEKSTVAQITFTTYSNSKRMLTQSLTECRAKLECLDIPASRAEDLQAALLAVDRAAGKAKTADTAIRAWKWFSDLKAPAKTYSKSAVGTEHRSLQKQFEPIADRLYELAVQEAALKASLVKLGECSFCGLDLTTVPKVAKENAEKQAKLTEVRAELASCESAKLAIVSRIAELSNILEANKPITRYPVGFVSTDPDIIPSVFQWIGGEVPAVPEDPAVMIAHASLLKKFEADRQQKLQQLAALESTLSERKAALERLVEVPEPILKLEDVKDYANNCKVLHLDAQESLTAAVSIKLHAERQLQTAQNKFTVDEAMYQQGLSQLDSVQLLLSTYSENNALIRRLREIRPQVAKRLWDAVLTFASQILTSIRQSTSLITHNSEEFLINGKLAAAYSGSARDMLGVAIRVALQKTFLPNLDFIMVDEPAGACDASRETELLGKLAALDYRQVLVITHSELADSFASNLIQIGES